MTTVIDARTGVPAEGHANGAVSANGQGNDTDALFEIVDGRRVEKVMSVYANFLALALFVRLNRYAEQTKTGRALLEIMFDLPRVNQERRPDVSYLRFETWPKERPLPTGDSLPIAPDLAVEVISPSNQWEAAMRKVREYFQAGVKLVWIILPRERLIYVHEGRTDVRLLSENEELTGGGVLPGFSVLIAELFQEAGTEEPSS
jgi:Uma2 family endonuclease